MDQKSPVYLRSKVRTDWGVMVSQAYRLSDKQFKTEAMKLARFFCARIRANVYQMTEVLSRSGYVFAFPNQVHVPYDGNALDWIAALENDGIYLPVFLQAWIAEVGSVNLMGSNPNWPKSGYSGIPNADADVWYTDPLVVEISESYLKSEYDNWRFQIDEQGQAEIGPFQLAIAPDHIHKANVSGGMPYAIDASSPSIDTLVLNARDCTSLFHHVANASAWGGFPGFNYIGDVIPEDVVTLRKNLVLI